MLNHEEKYVQRGLKFDAYIYRREQDFFWAFKVPYCSCPLKIK